MKYLYILGLLVCSCVQLGAQNFLWTQPITGTSVQWMGDVEVNDQGEIFALGWYFGTTTFDTIALANLSYDGFIAKYDSLGNVIWAKRFGGSNYDRGEELTIDDEGNLFISGSFRQVLTIGDSTYTGTASDDYDAFIAKLDPDGEVEWARIFTGAGNAKPIGIAADHDGNVIVQLSFNEVLNVGGLAYNTDTSAINEVMLVKYSATGIYQWAKHLQTEQSPAETSWYYRWAGGVAVDSSNNVYCTGAYRDSLVLDSFVLTGGTSTTYDVYLLKFSPSGASTWRVRGGGTSSDYASDLVIDANDRVFLSGFGYGNKVFGSVNAASSSWNTFVVEYNTSGIAQWMDQTGGGTNYYTTSLALDGEGSFYLTGNYNMNTNLGGFSLTNAYYNPFIAKRDYINGTWDWVIEPYQAGSAFDYPIKVAAHSEGQVYIGGQFSSNFTFGDSTLNTTGSYDAFVVKIGNCEGFSINAAPAGSASVCVGNTVVLESDSATHYTYKWIRNGALLSGNTNPTFEATLSGNYQVIVDSIGCKDTSDVIPVEINPLPIVSHAAFDPVCDNEPSFTLVGGSPSGGVYSGSGVVGGTQFDPSSAALGNNVLTYVYTDSNGCADSTSKILTVHLSPFIFNTSVAACENDSPFSLSGGFPGGGTYSGTGVSSNTFFPNVAGVGTHTVKYTSINGCEASDSITVTVTAAPSVSLAAIPAQCETNSFLFLTQGSPFGGTYSGSGVSNPFFVPSAAGAGSHQVIYTVTQSGCSASDTTFVTVDSLPHIVFNPLPELCIYDSALDVSEYVIPATSVLSGFAVDSGFFDPSVAGIGTFSITATHSNTCGADTAVDSITVLSTPVVSLGSFSPVCLNDSSFALSGGSPASGTYFGEGVAAGVFTPAIAGVGVHTIGYSSSNSAGCTDTAYSSISVAPLPTVSLTIEDTICENGGLVALGGGSPIGGALSGVGVSGSSFDPTTSGVGNIQILYTYTDSLGCSNVDSSWIEVLMKPVVTWSLVDTICYESDSLTLIGGTPAGGTYFGSGVVGNEFIPQLAGLGNHSLSYTYENTSGCSDTTQSTVFVKASPVVSIPHQGQHCVNEDSVMMTGGNPSGGTYSGVGVSNGVFAPSAVGVGTFEVIYTYTDAIGCTASDTAEVVVEPLPIVSLSLEDSVCENEAPLNLSSGTPLGGIYTGSGVVAGVFNPSAAGFGNHTISYSFTDSIGCEASDTSWLFVKAQPNVGFNLQDSICLNSGPIALDGGSPIGGLYFGTGVLSGQFDPLAAGVGAHTLGYVYIDSVGCSDTANAGIEVLGLPSVSITEPGPFCISDGAQTLVEGSPSGGVYGGPAVSLGMFYPDSSGVGTSFVTYSFEDSLGCMASDTSSVMVNPLPVLVVDTTAKVCVSVSAYTLNLVTPTGGDYSGSFVSSGSFNAAAAGIGTHSLHYAYTDVNGCSDSVDFTIEVVPLPNVTLPAFSPVCEGGASLSLSGGLPLGGVYSGTGISSGTFSPAVAGTGSHTVSYTYTDSNGCSNTASQPLTVSPLPFVSIGAIAASCSNDGAFALTGSSPSGGSYSGIGVSGDTFSPGLAGVGSHSVYYQYSDSLGCINSDSTSAVVNAIPSVSLSGFTGVCASIDTVVLSGASPAGGVYSGSGVEAGLFLVDSVVSGAHQITYTYTDSNGCVAQATDSILVHPLPIVTLDSFSELCYSGSTYPLSGGAPVGGYYSGAGVVGGVMDPAVSGLGLFDIGYTYSDSNGCISSDTQSIEVLFAPTVTLDSFSSICENEAPFSLTGGIPAGGIYSGIGIDSNVFDPALAGVGSHLVQYVYSPVNGCPDTAYTFLSVLAAPVADMDSLASFCENLDSVVLSGGSPMGGSYLGPGVSGNSFMPSSVGAGSYFLGYKTTAINGCADSAFSPVTVLPSPAVSLDSFASVCEGTSALSLTGGLPFGGLYSGTGVDSGYFFPDSAGPGISLITYTFWDSNGCESSSTATISVDTLPMVAFPSLGSECVSVDTVILSGAEPIGGIYSGPAVFGNKFSPALAGVGVFSLQYTYTNALGCSDSATAAVTVNALPTVSIDSAPGVCLATDSVSLTGVPTGGWFAGAGVVAAAFAPSLAGVGAHDVQYIYSDSLGCTDSAYYVQEVYAQPTVTFNFTDTLCANEPAVVLSAMSPAGGALSGLGVSGNQFDPGLVGAGTFNPKYVFIDSNTCADSATALIVVDTVPIVSLAGIAGVCEDTVFVPLTGGAPVGGQYTGGYVSNDTFLVASSGSGSFTVFYSYSDQNGCTAQDSGILNVFSLPNVSLNISPDSVCEGTSLVLNGGSPVGGLFTGSLVSGSVFSADTLQGWSMVSYSFIDSNSCASSALDSIYTTTLVEAIAPPGFEMCLGSTVQLTGGLPLGGNYLQGTSVIPNSVFNADSVGIQEIGYAAGNGCGNDTAYYTINVLANPELSLGADSFICSTDTALFSNSGHVQYLWHNGSTDSTFLLYGSAMQGDSLLWLEVNDGTICSSRDTILMKLDENPGIDLGEDILACSDSVVNLSAGTFYASYLWSDSSQSAQITVHDGTPIPSDTFVFWVSGFTLLGCRADDTVSVAILDCDSLFIGVSETISRGWQVFPNPAREFIIIQQSGERFIPFEAEMYNLNGQSVLNASVGAVGQSSIDLSRLASGVYNLRILARGISEHRLIVIQH